MRQPKSAVNELRKARKEAGWTYLSEAKVEGKRYVLLPGRELKIRGMPRGSVFRFHELVRMPDGVEWITVFGGPSGHGQWHSFDPSRITWVSKKLPRRS